MAISGAPGTGRALPVPLREMSKGFSSASLLAMWIAALRAPVAPGLKVTVKTVLAPGASVVAAGPETVKSAAWLPSTLRAWTARFAVPVFLRVNDWAADDTPGSREPNATFAVPSARSEPLAPAMAISGAPGTGRALPVPLREMSKGFSSASLLAMWIAALRAPVAPGLKVTVKTVLAPGASVVAAGPETVKSAAWLPSTLSTRPARFAVPEFLRVNDWAAEDTPGSREPNATFAVPSARSEPLAPAMAISGTAGAKVVNEISADKSLDNPAVLYA